MADLRAAFTGGASGNMIDTGIRQMGSGAYAATAGTLENLARGGGQMLGGAGQAVAGVVGGTYNAATGATNYLAEGGIGLANKAAGAVGMRGGRRRRRRTGRKSHRKSHRKSRRMNRKNRKTNRRCGY